MAKLNWLDKFAQEQSKKMKKQASFNKTAEQIIINQEEIPNAVDGQELSYNNEMYRVLNANFKDDIGPGILLEKLNKQASFTDGDVLPDEMSMEMGVDSINFNGIKATVAPERAVKEDQNINDLHIEVRDVVEQDKYNKEAIETEQQIALENSIDRTTPYGRYNRIEKRVLETVDFLECEEFVDENKDGICDTCGLPEDECEEEIEDVISNKILNRIFDK